MSGTQLGSESETDSEISCEPPTQVVPFNFQLTSLQALQLLEVSVRTCHPYSAWLRGEAFKGLQQLTKSDNTVAGQPKDDGEGNAHCPAYKLAAIRAQLGKHCFTYRHTRALETVDGLSKLSTVKLYIPIHQMVVLQRPLSPFLAMPGLRTLEFLPADEGFPIDWDDNALKLLKKAAVEIKVSGSKLKLICPGL